VSLVKAAGILVPSKYRDTSTETYRKIKDMGTRILSPSFSSKYITSLSLGLIIKEWQ
jgi:hypothetical protein